MPSIVAVGGVAENIDIESVQDYLSGLKNVEEVHDLHIWGLSTAEVALTAHLVKPDPAEGDALIESATHELQERFGIDHVTLQWERKRLPGCQDGI